MKATAWAGANIAFIKYWGNSHPDLRVPLNNSISMTLDQAYTVTTVEFDPTLGGDCLELNGQAATSAVLARAAAHLDRLRALAGITASASVVSRNSFPTSAGIASSASGFAALTLAGAAALGLDLSPRDLSRLAPGAPRGRPVAQSPAASSNGRQAATMLPPMPNRSRRRSTGPCSTS